MGSSSGLAHPSNPSLRMLVLNDDKKNATAQAKTLSGRGFTVETSFAFEGAVSRLGAASFDVMVVNAKRMFNATRSELRKVQRSHKRLCIVLVVNGHVTIEGDGDRFLSLIGERELVSVFKGI